MALCEVDLTTNDHVQLDWTMDRRAYERLVMLARVFDGPRSSPMKTVERLVNQELKRLESARAKAIEDANRRFNQIWNEPVNLTGATVQPVDDNITWGTYGPK